MGNKTTKKKKHTQPGQTDRRIRGAILVLVILILCVAAYGISTLLPKGAGKKKKPRRNRRLPPSSSATPREPLRKSRRTERNATRSAPLCP